MEDKIEKFAKRAYDFAAAISGIVALVGGAIWIIAMSIEYPLAIAIVASSALLSGAIFYRKPIVEHYTYIGTVDGMSKEQQDHLHAVLKKVMEEGEK